MMTMKVCILKEWTRIFVPRRSSNAFFSWLCHGLAGVNVVFYATSILVINLSCLPHEKIWDKTIVGGHCIDYKPMWISSSVINLLSDIAIVALPQKIIWRLRVSTKKKIGIALVFTFGIL